MVFLNGSGNVSYVSPFYLGEKRILISFYFWKTSPISAPAMLECRYEANVNNHSGVLTPRWILVFLELLWFLFEKCKSVLWHRHQSSSPATCCTRLKHLKMHSKVITALLVSIVTVPIWQMRKFPLTKMSCGEAGMSVLRALLSFTAGPCPAQYCQWISLCAVVP